MTSSFIKGCEEEKQWFVIDAQDLILGRLATMIAHIIRGKHKPTYTPYLNCGDYVVVVNAEKLHLTGKKYDQDIFYWHTGYPGGIKQRSKRQILSGRFPQLVLLKAVERMVPRGPLGRRHMRHLRVYVGPKHPHVAQKPTLLPFASWNPKNKKRV